MAVAAVPRGQACRGCVNLVRKSAQRLMGLMQFAPGPDTVLSPLCGSNVHTSPSWSSHSHDPPTKVHVAVALGARASNEARNAAFIVDQFVPHQQTPRRPTTAVQLYCTTLALQGCDKTIYAK